MRASVVHLFGAVFASQVYCCGIIAVCSVVKKVGAKGESRTPGAIRALLITALKRNIMYYTGGMFTNLLIFAAALLVVVRGATFATKYASQFAKSFRISEFAVGFLIIAVISILPEMFIVITSALKGVPAFGLGTLMGSNVADLTLIVALVVLLSGRSMAIEQRILKGHVLYPLILLVPVILGFDGHFSRIEGVALILIGLIFYYLALREDKHASSAPPTSSKDRYLNLAFLLLSLVVLLAGAHLVVTSATALAVAWNVSPVLIGLVVVGLGTTMPELFFALKSMREREDSLAVGDVLGTVLADATIVIGILALLHPFHFPKTTIYIGGVFMVAASFILFSFMRSGRAITKKEAFSLIVFWVTFICVEFIVGI